MEIIPATEADIPELVELWVEFFDYHRDIDAYYTRSEDAHEHIEKRLREKIEGEDALVLSAVDAGKVVGYSLSWMAEGSPFVRENKYGLICELAVTSSHRGRGIGENLLERTLRWFETRGVKRIVIYTLAGNRRAIAFWKRHGFERTMQCMERLLDVPVDDERAAGR
jgi:ribosomal protein S18 acetylase RimI-like enzyme